MNILENNPLNVNPNVEDVPLFDFEAPIEDEIVLKEKLEKLAILQEQAEQNVKDKTLELSKAQAELASISEKRLPELMEELGCTQFTTQEGLSITVVEKIRASIAQGDAEKQQKAFDWLEDQGHGRLIKREFKIEFGKLEEAWANQFEGQLKRRKKPLRVTRKMYVHPATLAGFLTEQMEKGVEVPLEIFNGFPQKYSKLQRKK